MLPYEKLLETEDYSGGEDTYTKPEEEYCIQCDFRIKPEHVTKSGFCSKTCENRYQRALLGKGPKKPRFDDE